MSYSRYRRLQKAATKSGITPEEFRKRAFILGTTYGNLDVMEAVYAGNEQAHKEWLDAGKKSGYADVEYYKMWHSYFDDDERWFFYH